MNSVFHSIIECLKKIGNKDGGKAPSLFPLFSSHSIQGRKPKQEDDFLIWKDDRDVLVLVCDGVGGHGHGEFASNMVCHKVFEETLNSLPNGIGDDPEVFLRNTALIAAGKVYSKGIEDPSFKNCGTTVTGFLYRKDKGYWTINIGDSRVYLVRKDNVRQLTEDQTSDSSTRIMKYAIGQPLSKMQDHVDIFFWDEPEDELTEDSYLMAVTDGVCEPFEIPSVGNPHIYTDNDLFNSFLMNLTVKENSAKEIVNFSYNNGSKDNITCVMMGFRKG